MIHLGKASGPIEATHTKAKKIKGFRGICDIGGERYAIFTEPPTDNEVRGIK